MFQSIENEGHKNRKDPVKIQALPKFSRDLTQIPLSRLHQGKVCQPIVVMVDKTVIKQRDEMLKSKL